MSSRRRKRTERAPRQRPARRALPSTIPVRSLRRVNVFCTHSSLGPSSGAAYSGGMKTDFLHRCSCFGVFHERAPHETGCGGFRP